MILIHEFGHLVRYLEDEPGYESKRMTSYVEQMIARGSLGDEWCAIRDSNPEPTD